MLGAKWIAAEAPGVSPPYLFGSANYNPSFTDPRTQSPRFGPGSFLAFFAIFQINLLCLPSLSLSLFLFHFFGQ